MTKLQQTTEVILEFQKMGATAFQLMAEVKKCLNDESYLNGWYGFLKEAEK